MGCRAALGTGTKGGLAVAAGTTQRQWEAIFTVGRLGEGHQTPQHPGATALGSTWVLPEARQLFYIKHNNAVLALPSAQPRHCQ